MYGGDIKVILQPKNKFLCDNSAFNMRKKNIINIWSQNYVEQAWARIWIQTQSITRTRDRGHETESGNSKKWGQGQARNKAKYTLTDLCDKM